MSRLQHISKLYQNLAVILLNTVLLLVLLEGGAGLVLRVAPRPDRNDQFLEDVLRLQYYFSQDWARDYWTEHLEATQNWGYTPYALWRTNEYAGQYVNVDTDGKRLTLNGNNGVCLDGQYRIFIFGGSTVWGFGGRDGDTIPSFIQAQLPNVCVVNYGELGYNSTQELIRLQQELQTGDIPDMVIFYDGMNDVSTANRYGEAGEHFYWENIYPVVRSQPVSNPIQSLIRGTNLYRLIIGEPPPSAAPNLAVPPFEDSFITTISETYLTNLRTVEALSQEYGFEFFAFVQPTLAMSERELSTEEQTFITQMPGSLADLIRTVYPIWETEANRNPNDYLFYFGTALDDIQEIVWIDSHHLTPWGNLAMSSNILSIIQSSIGQ
jgi:lysophospholipase L1-like esterase